MKTETAVAALAALAQETRLAVFRALVQAGAEGLPAGRIAAAVGAPASTLSFHLKELAAVDLVCARQDGRFIFYTANYPAKCCQGMPAPQVARIGQAVASCCSAQPIAKSRNRA